MAVGDSEPTTLPRVAQGHPPTIRPSAGPLRPSHHRWLRGSLAGLTAFMALTAIYGAIFVVPTMPRAVLRQGLLALFPDFTIPALALGVLCGGSAVVAFVAVLARPRLGGLTSVVAGILMIAFELVEIVVVGFTPVMAPDQFPAWLQVVYLIIGAALVILGMRLRQLETSAWRIRTQAI
jgi:hypothetical protein